MQYEPGKAPSPRDVAQATLYVLGDIVASCSPEKQPTRETVDLFLGLYRELNEPLGEDQDRLKGIEAAVKQLERGISGLTKQFTFGQLGPRA